MKKLILLSVVLLSSVVAVPASAEWMLTHGNSTHVAILDNIIQWWNTVYRFEDALDFMQKPNVQNHLYAAVPTKSGGTWGATKIRVILYLGKDIQLTRIRVHNGGTEAWSKNLTWAGGSHDTVFNLGSKINFSRSLGITLDIKAGSSQEDQDRRVRFIAAGAYFTQ